MISIQNVSKKYGKFVALDDVCFRLPSTGLVVLTGENGCGKTTLLNLLSTYDTDYTGDISFNSVQYQKKNYGYLRNGVISYIQQDNLFSEYLTIRENIAFSGVSESKARRELQAYGMEDKLEADPNELSGGQKQKCSFIRGTQRESAVLLVDEPTNNMDEASEELTFQKLREVSERKLVVVVSHNRFLVNKYADLILQMARGRIENVIQLSKIGAMETAGEEVWVPENDFYNISYDWSAIRQIIARKGRAVLQFLPERDREKRRGESEERPEPVVRKNRYSRRAVLRNSLRSVKSQPVRNAMAVLFSSVFLIVLALFLCLSTIDTDRVAYALLKENGYGNVLYQKDAGVAKNPKDFSYSWLSAFEKKFGTSATIVEKMDSTIQLLDMDASLNPQYAMLRGINYTDLNQIAESDWAIKPKDKATAAVITDFVADQLVSAGKYSSYEEIVSTGIHRDGADIPVTGILKTNYREYPYLLDESVEITTKEAQDIDYLSRTVFNQLYVDRDSILDFSADGIAMLPVNHGRAYAQVRILEDSSGLADESCMYINEALASLCGDCVKSEFLGMPLDKTVLSDGLKEPVVYVMREQYEKNAADLMDRFPVDGVLFPLDSYEEYAYFTQFKAMHDTPVSDIAEKVMTVTFMVRDGLGIITAGLILLVFLFSIWIMTDSERKVKYTVFSMVTNGYRGADVFLFKAVKTGIIGVGICAVSFLLYFLVSRGLNSVLLRFTGYVIPLFSDSLAAIAEANGLYLGCLLLYVTLGTVSVCRRNPMKLYLSILKKK